MKKLLIAIAGIAILCLGIFLFLKKNTTHPSSEQSVLDQTYTLSKKYVALRYQTDNVLIDAKKYPDHASWNKQLSEIIKGWEQLETDSQVLEKSANTLAQEKVSFHIISQVTAYDKQEISNIFDKAPAGKKIATLAKHLGVDAKKAYKILQQDQDQVTADAWNEAGDIFQKLETSAVVIKDGCKIAGFVGGVIMSGGTSAIAAGSALTQAGVVVTGADLVLEVTDDGAKIALGNHNKVSSLVSSARTVTEPIASILAISNIPGNMATKLEKFNTVMIGLEQFNSAAQEGKIVGIELPAYTKDKTKGPIKVAVLNKEEIKEWLAEKGTSLESEKISEIETLLGIPEKQKETETKEVVAESAPNGSIVGVWEGMMYFTAGQNKAEEQENIVFNFKSDGTVEASNEKYEFFTYAQMGDLVRLYEEEKTDGYYEFSLSGDSMTFIKLAGIDGEGKWSEVMAGGDFFGGKFLKLTLKKQ